MEKMSVDEERKERFLFDKKSIYCEGIRRAIEVQAHAMKLTHGMTQDGGLARKLEASIQGNIEQLNSALTELR